LDLSLRLHGLLELGTEKELHALLLEYLQKLLREILVHARAQTVHRFDHRHLGAEAEPHASHLKTDDTASDNDQMFGNLVELQSAGARHDQLAVVLGGRNLDRLATGRDDDVLRFMFRHRAIGGRDRYASRPSERAATLKPGDLVL